MLQWRDEGGGAMQRTELVYIEGPDGRIEGAWCAAGGSRAALLCHPHPLYGGSLHDGVVGALHEACIAAGISTLRFNFRGVGGSAGAHDRGEGEAADTAFLLGWLRAERGCDVALLAGYSFGGGVALRAALEAADSPRRLLLVAPAFSRGEVPTARVLRCPLLLIQGAADRVIDTSANRAWLAALESPAELIELPGADHFFSGALSDMVRALGGRLS